MPLERQIRSTARFQLARHSEQRFTALAALLKRNPEEVEAKRKKTLLSINLSYGVSLDSPKKS